MTVSTRKFIDCSEFPSEKNCTLKISGTEDEVLAVAREHARVSHGHQDGPELIASLRAAMHDETATAHR